MVFGSVQAGGSAAAARQDLRAAVIGFENCTVEEAIAQLSAETGVRIETSGPIKRRIGQRVYRNRAVEEILLDLLRSENCAVVWHFRGARLDAAVVFLAGDATAMAFDAVDDPHGTALGTNAASSSDTADDQPTEAVGFERREQRPAGLETAPAVDNTLRSAVLKKPAKQSGPILAAGRLVAGGRAQSAQAQAADNETDEPEHQAEPVGGANGPPAPAAYGGLEPPPMPPAF